MRVAWAVTSAVLVATALAACSLTLDQSADQCHSDSDCVRFRTTCNLVTKLCSPRGITVDATVIVHGGDARDAADVTEAAPEVGNGGPSTPLATASGPTGDWVCGKRDKPLVRVQGDLATSDRWICANDYLLIGPVFVRPGTTLTIDAGTTVLGDVTSKGLLVVQPGARLVADGLRMAPIVFTSSAASASRKPGDWGGVALLGKAWSNASAPIYRGVAQGGEYGGTDDGDSSGVLRFVRIEYAGGIANDSGAGLGLFGVGRNTAINHVEVRESAGDCFIFAGGTAAAKHLLCQHPGDDGFEWQGGYRGRLQFLAFQGRPPQPGDPEATAREGHHAIEGHNEPTGAVAAPISEPVIWNLTLCGTRTDPPGEQYGMLLRHGTRAHINNAVVTGFDAALDVRDSGTAIELRGSVLWPRAASPEGGGSDPATADDDGGLDEAALVLAPALDNKVMLPNLGDCFDPFRPGFAPSPALRTGAGTPPVDGFFEPAAYLGAFRDLEDDWARAPWAVFGER